MPNKIIGRRHDWGQMSGRNISRKHKEKMKTWENNKGKWSVGHDTNDSNDVEWCESQSWLSLSLLRKSPPSLAPTREARFLLSSCNNFSSPTKNKNFTRATVTKHTIAETRITIHFVQIWIHLTPRQNKPKTKIMSFNNVPEALFVDVSNNLLNAYVLIHIVSLPLSQSLLICSPGGENETRSSAQS